MRPLLRAAVLAVAFAAGPASAALSVVVLPATGSNIHPGHLAASTDVLRVQLEKAGYVLVPAPAGAPQIQEPTPDQAGEAATKAGASLAITLRIARLGTNAVARIGAYLPDGKLARSDELTAASPEDLEAVLRRLALSIATGRSAKELAELDSVSERESDPYLKYVATHLFGLKLGAFFVQDRAEPGAESLALNGGGLFWMYDARWFIGEVALDLQKGEGDSLLSIGIGAYYPFTRGTVAPYLGGGLAYSWADHGGAWGEGIAFRVGGGLIVGRLSTVQFRLDGGLIFDAFPITETVSGKEHYAWGPQLSLGLAF
jgi:hypothetical protein